MKEGNTINARSQGHDVSALMINIDVLPWKIIAFHTTMYLLYLSKKVPHSGTSREKLPSARTGMNSPSASTGQKSHSARTGTVPKRDLTYI